MDIEFKYRGQIYSGREIAFVRQLIEKHSGASRRALSKKLCREWNWVQKNGALRDMVCRSFMLELERAGHIVLPAQKRNPPNNLAKRMTPVKVDVDQTPVCGKLSGIAPIEFCQVRRQKHEPLFNSLIEQFHYLGYCQPVGEHLKYLFFAGDRPIACMTWSSAPRHIGCNAANWKYLGKTTGRGKDDQTHVANRSIKDVLGYPLSKNFRSNLGVTGKP